MPMCACPCVCVRLCVPMCVSVYACTRVCACVRVRVQEILYVPQTFLEHKHIQSGKCKHTYIEEEREGKHNNVENIQRISIVCRENIHRGKVSTVNMEYRKLKESKHRV